MAIPQGIITDIMQVKIYMNLYVYVYVICTFSQWAVLFFSSCNMAAQGTSLTPLLVPSTVLT